jgi:hypothetical protein
MLRDLQIIFAILIMLWLFFAAKKVGKSPAWAFAGLAAFLAPSFLGSLIFLLIVLPAIYPDLVRSVVTILIIQAIFAITGSAIGFVIVYRLYKTKLLTPQQSDILAAPQFDKQPSVKNDNGHNTSHKETFDKGLCPECLEKINSDYTKCFACGYDFYVNKLIDS